MSGLWRAAVRVRGADATAAITDIFDELCGTVSAFEEPDDPALWRVEAFAPAALLTAALEIRIELAAAASGGAVLALTEERFAERDWLGENLLSFPPLQVGPFWIHGSHDRAPPPPGAIAIEIDAATAFGTGEHPSTRGCLLALAALAQRGRYRAPLDIGTGTGILAIAAAKRLHRRVTARDIDPGAVAMARHNAARNRVAGQVTTATAAGYRGSGLRRRHYDLVFANILARPLAAMASELAAALAPGGSAVLSGLLRRQEAFVLAAHRAVGLALDRRIVIDGWSTLVLRGPPVGSG